MRTRKKTTTASLLGFTMLLAACSGTGEGEIPNALAFQDSSSDPVPAESDPAPDAGDPAPDAGDEAPERVFSPRPNVSCSSSTFSVAFGASDILFDSAFGSDTIGPIDIALPAGTYDITVATWLGPYDDPNQTMEQWSFTTDSDYESPLTSDSSPVLQQNQTFEDVDLAATTQITLQHKNDTGVANSVHPLCIGFELQEEPVVTTTTAAPVVTTTTAAPVVTTTTAAPVVTTTTAAPVETTTTAAPVETTTTAAPVVTPTTEVVTEVVAPTTTAAPVVTTTTEAPVEVTTTTEAPAVTATTAAPAAGTTALAAQTAAPELALTGPSDLAASLGATGAALILAGGAAVVAARRSNDD